MVALPVKSVHIQHSYTPETQLMIWAWSLVHACVATVAALTGEMTVICIKHLSRPLALLGPSNWYSCFWSSAHINNYVLHNFSNLTSAHAHYGGFAVSCRSVVSIAISLSKLSEIGNVSVIFVGFSSFYSFFLCLFVGIALGCCVWR